MHGATIKIIRSHILSSGIISTDYQTGKYTSYPSYGSNFAGFPFTMTEIRQGYIICEILLRAFVSLISDTVAP
jgi:hypothetical protein